MSKKFHAVDRETGERWKSSSQEHQYLVMYDSGYLAVVTEGSWDNSIDALSPKRWKKVMHGGKE